MASPGVLGVDLLHVSLVDDHEGFAELLELVERILVAEGLLDFHAQQRADRQHRQRRQGVLHEGVLDEVFHRGREEAEREPARRKSITLRPARGLSEEVDVS